MKNYFFFFFLALLFVSCNSSRERYYMYKDAESDFCSSLTSQDTSAVLGLTDSFMTFLKSSCPDSAASMLCTLDQGVLYNIADSYKNQLVSRFSIFPVKEFRLLRYSFSTSGNNDVCYQYLIDGSDDCTMKVVFNPVKIDGKWFLALKDGSQSSIDKRQSKQIHPDSPAPSEPILSGNFK